MNDDDDEGVFGWMEIGGALCAAALITAGGWYIFFT